MKPNGLSCALLTKVLSIILLSLVLGAPATAKQPNPKPPKYKAGVAQTGQGFSYGPRDDGYFQAGVTWPDLRFTDNGDGTVTDNLTGLTWLANANCFGALNWQAALNAANTLADGTCGLADGSQPEDWRLPNVRELPSLIDYGVATIPILGDPFLSVATNTYYWASTSGAFTTSNAWGVRFLNGRVLVVPKTSNLYVLPVRGGL